MIKFTVSTAMALLLCSACSAGKSADNSASPEETAALAKEAVVRPQFDADSAYANVGRLVEFGPRVPNTAAHRRAGDWLASQLKDYGWEVTEQKATLEAFDGTKLQARNIFGRLNPEKENRLLLLAHWDSRPWADQDQDPEKRRQAVLGANDGASGVGVLLEIARQLSLQQSDAAVDILFVDAEDWGEDSNEESWALGTRYFTENPPVKGYRPMEAILLDMVGSPDARFGQEYFSQNSNPGLIHRLWTAAAALGHDDYFVQGFGGAVTDDHVQLIEHGIPSVDIIDYRYSRDYQGFDPVWHTTRDDMANISPRTLGAVGETILHLILTQQ